MPLAKVGLNISALDNLPQPNLTLPNTSSDWVNQIPIKANEVTGGYLGLGVLIATFSILLYTLSDELGGFRYSLLRSSAIGCAICSIMGLFCLSLGYFTVYYHVVLFMVGTGVLSAMVWKAEP